MRVVATTILVVCVLAGCAHRRSLPPPTPAPVVPDAVSAEDTRLRWLRTGTTGPMADPELLRRLGLNSLENGFPEGMAWVERASAAEQDIRLSDIDCRAAGKAPDTQAMYDCMVSRRYYYQSRRPAQAIVVPASDPLFDLLMKDRSIRCTRTPLGAMSCQ